MYNSQWHSLCHSHWDLDNHAIDDMSQPELQPQCRCELMRNGWECQWKWHIIGKGMVLYLSTVGLAHTHNNNNNNNNNNREHTDFSETQSHLKNIQTVWCAKPHDYTNQRYTNEQMKHTKINIFIQSMAKNAHTRSRAHSPPPPPPTHTHTQTRTLWIMTYK